MNWQLLWPAVAYLLAALVVIWALAYVCSWVWSSFFGRLAAKTQNRFDALFIRSTRRPIRWLVIVFGAQVAFDWFLKTIEANARISADVSGFFYLAGTSVTAYTAYATLRAVLTWYSAEIAARTHSDFDNLFAQLGKRLAGTLTIFLLLIIVLDHFNINVSGFIATASVASLAVAFAAQETLANMISGFTLMVDRTYREGDRVELEDGSVGDVQEIGLRTTKILSFDHTLILVPNKELAAAKVINHSYPDHRVVARIKVSVARASDIGRVKAILFELCNGHPKVLDDPAPAVYFTEFAESALNMLAVCWVANYQDRFGVIDEINTAIAERFKAEGIEIPFPQRDVHVMETK